MKLEVWNEEKAKRGKKVVLKLLERTGSFMPHGINAGGISIGVVDEEGMVICKLLYIDPVTGKYHMNTNVNPSLGLCLDDKGRLVRGEDV